MRMSDAVGAALLALLVSSPALSQPLAPPRPATLTLSGPRFGATVLSNGVSTSSNGRTASSCAR